MGQLFPNVQPEVAQELVQKGVITMADLHGYELRPCGYIQSIEDAMSKPCDIDSAGTSAYQVCTIVFVECVHVCPQLEVHVFV